MTSEDTVPFSERRHRLRDVEIPEVMAGLRLRLAQLLEAREDPASAEISFKALYRMENYMPHGGKPGYPEPVTWQLIEEFLDNGAVTQAGAENLEDPPEASP
jgi:hypothetical protein